MKPTSRSLRQNMLTSIVSVILVSCTFYQQNITAISLDNNIHRGIAKSHHFWMGFFVCWIFNVSPPLHCLSEWRYGAERVWGKAEAAAARVCTQREHLGDAARHQGAGNARVHGTCPFTYCTFCFREDGWNLALNSHEKAWNTWKHLMLSFVLMHWLTEEILIAKNNPTVKLFPYCYVNCHVMLTFTYVILFL